MKHLREYEESEIKDLVSDLKTVGHSDWMGFYITYQLYSDGSVGANAIAVVGESWKKVAKMILSEFGIDDPKEFDIDISSLESIDDIMNIADETNGSDMGSEWRGFEFKYQEMNPKRLENSIESAYLLETGDVLEMGRRYFSDFDSKILQRRY